MNALYLLLEKKEIADAFVIKLIHVPWSTPSDGCKLTLDPNTTNKRLSLSKENRKVTWGTEKQPYLYNRI